MKLDSISLPDICTESSECHTGFCNSGSDHIINVHCSGESVSQVGEFINNFKFLSIHSNGWLVVRVGIQPLSFCTDCEIIVIKTVRLDLWRLAFLPLSWHSYPYHLHRGAHLEHQSAP